MIIAGKKVGTRYGRSIPGFEDKVELGIVVPFNDNKYLDAFASHTISSDVATSVSQLPLSEAMDSRVSTEYVEDLDGDFIRSAAVGPSTDDEAKHLTQLRPAKRDSGDSDNKTLLIDRNSQNIADTLRMPMKENDNVIIGQLPEEYDVDFATSGGITVRTPKMVSISKHTNSLMLDFTDNVELTFPMTEKSSISPDFVYRFSFYYRAIGDFSIIPSVEYYSNSGALIETKTYDSWNVSSASDTETSDFRHLAIAIPRIGIDELIHSYARRLRVKLTISNSGSAKFELVYPILEYALRIQSSLGFIFMTDPPSLFRYKENTPGEISTLPTGRIASFDPSKVFYGSLGRSLFDLDLDFSIMDASFVQELRKIEQMNMMGYKIALRTKHPDLPPVLVGNMKIETSNPTFDYQINDVSLKFEETT